MELILVLVVGVTVEVPMISHDAPSTHKDYEAIFTGRPNNTYRNQYFNPKVVGQPIKVYWSQHPNTSVTQYKVYRKPKYGSESCVGTFTRINFTQRLHIYRSGYGTYKQFEFI